MPPATRRCPPFSTPPAADPPFGPRASCPRAHPPEGGAPPATRRCPGFSTPPPVGPLPHAVGIRYRAGYPDRMTTHPLPLRGGGPGRGGCLSSLPFIFLYAFRLEPPRTPPPPSRLTPPRLFHTERGKHPADRPQKSVPTAVERIAAPVTTPPRRMPYPPPVSSPPHPRCPSHCHPDPHVVDNPTHAQ